MKGITSFMDQAELDLRKAIRERAKTRNISPKEALEELVPLQAIRLPEADPSRYSTLAQRLWSRHHLEILEVDLSRNQPLVYQIPRGVYADLEDLNLGEPVSNYYREEYQELLQEVLRDVWLKIIQLWGKQG